MITFDESIRAVIFVAFADRADFMVAVRDHPNGAGYVIEGRTRHYAEGPGDPFDDRDSKHWFQATTQGSLEVAIHKVIETGLSLAQLAMLAGRVTQPVEVHNLVRGSMSLNEFVRHFREAPFAHEKRVQ